jgi:hypothetical protein
MPMKLRTKIDLAVLSFVLLVAAIAVPRAEAIGDWWHFLSYEPSENIQRLADDAGMSEAGKRYFYRFSPVIVDDAELTEQCGGVRHGCIYGRNIYIRSQDYKNNYNSAVVTAAHEMLHVAYERMSKADKDVLHNKLNSQLRSPYSSEARKKIEEYPPLEFYNEAHSFIGTEVETLSPELENYYADFFDERAKVTSAYKDSK